MSNSTQENVKSGSADTAERWTLTERCIVAVLAGAFAGGALSGVLTALKYGGMGHGGTSTDWGNVFNVAIGLGALIGAVFGVALTVLMFFEQKKGGSSPSFANQDSPHE